MSKEATPGALGSHEWLGPLPEADMTMPSIAPDGPDGAHFYRASTVRQLLAAERELCQPNGLKFDALGEPRTRYVRVSLEGNHCVMHPSEGDRYLADARANDDDSPYVVADVWLSEREFDDLPEHDGF